METSQYSCHGYHKDLPKGKASGQVRLDHTGLTFLIADQTVKLSYAGLEMSLGGASDRIVFIKHPAVKEWSFYTSDRSILNDPHLKAHPNLTPQINRAKNKRRANWAVFACISALILAIPILFLFKLDLLTEVVAEQVPPSWEQQLGESAIGQYSLSHEFMEDEEAERLLGPLVAPLIEALDDSKYDYHFYIVNEASLNAFALPGGYIVVHSALILKADDAEELLGVLAHELTHVEEQHGVRNVIGAAGIYALASALFGDVSGILATAAGAAPILLNQSYSRKFETEADTLGFDLLVRANIDPSGLHRFFEKMIEEEKQLLDNIEDEEARELVKDALGFLSTHPASDKRVQYLREMAANTNGNYIDLQSEFLALKEATKTFVAEETEEETLDEGGN